MKDLRDRMEPVCRAAARLAPEQGARCIMFMSAPDGEGPSRVAAPFALPAAQKSHRPVWLVDLGLRRNDQYRGFQKGFAKKVGKPGRAFDGSLRTLPFYSVGAEAGVKSDPPKTQRLLAVHQIEGSRLLVTRFRNEALKKGQRVQLRTRPEWWQQVRRAASTVISCCVWPTVASGVNRPTTRSERARRDWPCMSFGLNASGVQSSTSVLVGNSNRGGGGNGGGEGERVDHGVRGDT